MVGRFDFMKQLLFQLEKIDNEIVSHSFRGNVSRLTVLCYITDREGKDQDLSLTEL